MRSIEKGKASNPLVSSQVDPSSDSHSTKRRVGKSNGVERRDGSDEDSSAKARARHQEEREDLWKERCGIGF